MSEVKFINRGNLKIARENIGLDTATVSDTITTTGKDLVSEWEAGNTLPTWRQIAKLAKLYNISELLLLSEKSIPRFKSVPDYRVGVDKENDTQVHKLVNLVLTRQTWLEKRLRDSGTSRNSLQGSGRRINDPAQLAEYISNRLDIKLEDIKEISGTYSRKKTLDYLIKKAESKGIFVGKTISYHRVEVEDLRGVFISNEYCPFIILNRRDSLSAQIFSFIHELAHLFRKTDAISNSLSFRSTDRTVDPEEVFCNKVAANLLLPESEFGNEFYDKPGIELISQLYKVSEIFVFYRLKDLGKIHRDRQADLERTIRAEMENNLRIKKEEKATSTGGSHINNMKDSNGSLFNRVVYNSFLENRIGYTEAANLLRYSPEKI